MQGNGDKQSVVQEQTGKEIVTVDTNIGQQSRGNFDCQQTHSVVGKEIFPVTTNVQQSPGNAVEKGDSEDVVHNQQIQTTNMFAALEDQDGEEQDKKQMDEVDNSVVKSPTGVTVKRLNPKAATFSHITGDGSTLKRRKDTSAKQKEKGKEGFQKDSTATGVNRTFGKNMVTVNQSCHDVP